MRYERVKDVVRLAVRLQAAAGGLTLEDIQADFAISRSRPSSPTPRPATG